MCQKNKHISNEELQKLARYNIQKQKNTNFKSPLGDKIGYYNRHLTGCDKCNHNYKDIYNKMLWEESHWTKEEIQKKVESFLSYGQNWEKIKDEDIIDSLPKEKKGHFTHLQKCTKCLKEFETQFKKRKKLKTPQVSLNFVGALE